MVSSAVERPHVRPSTATRARAPPLCRSFAPTYACYTHGRSACPFWRRQAPRWCFDGARAGGWQRRAVRDVAAAAAASANSEPPTPLVSARNAVSSAGCGFRARDAMALVAERPLDLYVRLGAAAETTGRSARQGEVESSANPASTVRWMTYESFPRLWRRVSLLSRADDSRRCQSRPRWSVMSTSTPLTTASDGRLEHERLCFDAFQHQQPPRRHRSEDAIFADAEHLQIGSVFSAVQLSDRNSGLAQPCATTMPRGRRSHTTLEWQPRSLGGCYGR